MSTNCFIKFYFHLKVKSYEMEKFYNGITHFMPRLLDVRPYDTRNNHFCKWMRMQRRMANHTKSAFRNTAE